MRKINFLGGIRESYANLIGNMKTLMPASHNQSWSVQHNVEKEFLKIGKILSENKIGGKVHYGLSISKNQDTGLIHIEPGAGFTKKGNSIVIDSPIDFAPRYAIGEGDYVSFIYLEKQYGASEGGYTAVFQDKENVDAIIDSVIDNNMRATPKEMIDLGVLKFSVSDSDKYDENCLYLGKAEVKIG